MSSRTTGQVIPFRTREEVYSLEGFLRAVDRKRFDQAVTIAAEVFLLGDAMALEALGRYVERSRLEPILRERLLLLRPLLEEGALEDVLRIVEDCFDVRGMDALWMIQAFQQSQNVKINS